MVALIRILGAIVIFSVLAAATLTAAVAHIGRMCQPRARRRLVIRTVSMTMPLRTFSAELLAAEAAAHVGFRTGFSVNAQRSEPILRMFDSMPADLL